MLQSEVQTAARSARLDGLSEAVLQALTAGASPTDLMATISATITDYQASIQESIPGLLTCDDAEVIYDELPDGLIDLPTASEKYGLKRGTIRTWIIKGYLDCHGRLKNSARGGGYLVVSEGELLKYKDAPRSKGGRPRKNL